MNGRAEFNLKGEEILDFIDTYGVLKYEYIDKFFPQSNKILSYLIKNRRLHKSADGIYISADHDSQPMKSVITALGVLADIFEKVQTHTRATAPAQISFITHSGDYYEILYVGYGMEAMITASYETQLAAKQRLKDYADITKRIAIIEDKNQMTRLPIPGIVRFALIQPNGNLSYFKGS